MFYPQSYNSYKLMYNYFHYILKTILLSLRAESRTRRIIPRLLLSGREERSFGVSIQKHLDLNNGQKSGMYVFLTSAGFSTKSANPNFFRPCRNQEVRREKIQVGFRGDFSLLLSLCGDKESKGQMNEPKADRFNQLYRPI